MRTSIIFSIFLFMTNITGYAQIDIMPSTDFQTTQTPEKEKFEYDSLSNFEMLGKAQYAHLIGQKIYFLPDKYDRYNVKIKKKYKIKKEISKKEAKYLEKKR